MTELTPLSKYVITLLIKQPSIFREIYKTERSYWDRSPEDYKIIDIKKISEHSIPFNLFLEKKYFDLYKNTLTPPSMSLYFNDGDTTHFATNLSIRFPTPITNLTDLYATSTPDFFLTEDLLALLLKYTLVDPYYPQQFGELTENPYLTYIGKELIAIPETDPILNSPIFKKLYGKEWIQSLKSNLSSFNALDYYSRPTEDPRYREFCYPLPSLEYTIYCCEKMNLKYPSSVLFLIINYIKFYDFFKSLNPTLLTDENLAEAILATSIEKYTKFFLISLYIIIYESRGIPSNTPRLPLLRTCYRIRKPSSLKAADGQKLGSSNCYFPYKSLSAHEIGQMWTQITKTFK